MHDHPAAAVGVGISCSPGLCGLAREVRDLVDLYEVSPDLLCQETVVHGQVRLIPDEAMVHAVEAVVRDAPVVYHGLTLSIGSVAGWNDAYVDMLDGLFARRAPVWHSEHLGFLYFDAPSGSPASTGIPLPMPFTDEAATLIADRIRRLQERYRAPFLLENTAYYLPELPADPGWNEAVFLNEVARRSGCGLLLDLHNLYCNARNHGFSAEALIEQLDLSSVAEVHLAGGVEHTGYLLDVHSRLVPEPVWRLFELVAARAPNLRAVIFELMEQALPSLPTPAVRDTLRQVRALWRA
ncbi:MAG TPA: DUF692 family protein [Kofleriaceae bacterium]|nr:DUF692 family protein [Kofleriaceae bacterium]